VSAPGVTVRAPAASRAINPWIVAAAVVIPTFMEVLDTTIANVALRYMAGGLSAPASDSEWVITSYLAANAIVLPMSGWLSSFLGRRNYFLGSIAVFTLASALCGMASSLGMLIAARVLQGLAGGGLQPSSQGVLLDAFPPNRQGAAMTLFGVAALLAPVVGPSLGGWITDHYSWRWIFYINIPVGIVALLLCRLVVTDPAYIREQRQEMRTSGTRFDTPGLCLLAATMVCWEVILSKGQEWDWFGDPFWRVQTVSVLFVGCLVGLIFRELRIENPLINFRVLKDRNLRASCLVIFCTFGVLYANTTQLPGLLQSLFGYDATTSGLVLSPAGVFAVIALFIVGGVLGRGVDARWLIGIGLVVLSAGCYWMSRLNLAISPWHVVWPRVVVILGLSFVFAPLNVAAFMYIPKELRGAAVGLLALLRNEGGSVGTSAARTLLERREQLHTERLGEHIDVLQPQVARFTAQAHGLFLRATGDPHHASLMGVRALADARHRQALSLSYFDVFWTSAALAAALVPLLLLMRRSAAAKGEHVAAE